MAFHSDQITWLIDVEIIKLLSSITLDLLHAHTTFKKKDCAFFK